MATRKPSAKAQPKKKHTRRLKHLPMGDYGPPRMALHTYLTKVRGYKANAYTQMSGCITYEHESPDFPQPIFVEKGGAFCSKVGSLELGNDVVIGAGVKFYGDAKLGDSVNIGSNTRIGTAVVMGEGVIVGKDCDIGLRVTLHKDAYVGEGCNIDIGSIIDQDCHVEDYVHIGRSVKLGHGSVVKSSAVVGACCTLGRFCTVGVAAHLSGSSRLGAEVLIKGQAVLPYNARVGDDSIIGYKVDLSTQSVNFGAGAIVPDNATAAWDLGYADGYRKVLSNVKGVATITAGCRHFPLDSAECHWSTKDGRRDTMALMAAARIIAENNKLRTYSSSKTRR